MTEESRPAAVGFHSGELAVQRQAGVQAQAARLAPMLARGQLRAGMAAFIGDANFAAITARDGAGRLWTSPLIGEPGFVQSAAPTTLRITPSLSESDPLYGLPERQPVGVIVIDFLTRRRARINGFLTGADAERLTIDVDQAYGNCPKYIHRRHLQTTEAIEGGHAQLYHGHALRRGDIRLIETADTFFLGTSHPTAGNDASHRGGAAGFVHATPEHVWWPDYPGNNLFNSLGNLTADPAAALLFLDFHTGTALQLAGTAAPLWDDATAPPGGDLHPRRQVQFNTRRVIARSAAVFDRSWPSPARTTHRCSAKDQGGQHV